MRDILGAAYADFYVNARTKAVEDRYEAIEGKAAKVGIADAREIGSSDAGSTMGGAYGQIFTVQRLNDFGCQDGLELFSVRRFMPQIPE